MAQGDQEGNPRDFPELSSILERIRENEEIARKFFEIEVSILSILDFQGLFERLLSEIREKFGIPCVWISMIRRFSRPVRGSRTAIHLSRSWAMTLERQMETLTASCSSN